MGQPSAFSTLQHGADKRIEQAPEARAERFALRAVARREDGACPGHADDENAANARTEQWDLTCWVL